MLSNSKLVQYVGNKPLKRDTVTRSGLVWTPGEVIEVETQVANRLLQFPDVWREYHGESKVSLADAGTATVPVSDSASTKKASRTKKSAAKAEQKPETEGDVVGEDEINAMDETQLRELVQDTGLEVVFEDGESVESMRAKVIAAASGE